MTLSKCTLPDNFEKLEEASKDVSSMGLRVNRPLFSTSGNKGRALKGVKLDSEFRTCCINNLQLLAIISIRSRGKQTGMAPGEG